MAQAVDFGGAFRSGRQPSQFLYITLKCINHALSLFLFLPRRFWRRICCHWFYLFRGICISRRKFRLFERLFAFTTLPKPLAQFFSLPHCTHCTTATESDPQIARTRSTSSRSARTALVASIVASVPSS